MIHDLASKTVLMLGVCALCLGTRQALCVEAAKEKAPASLEQQIEHLEGSLAEALRSRDWKMLELAADGFKAAKLTGKDLEISILRAELKAAFEAMNSYAGRLRAQIEVWALAARVRAGDEKALAELRALSAKELAAVAAPTADLWKKNQAEYKAVQKAYLEFVLVQEKRDHALLCLALQKEPGIQERALAILGAKTKPEQNAMAQGMVWGGSPMGTDPNVAQLVLAILASEPQAGFASLVSFCSNDDPKASVDVQVSAYHTLIELANPDTRYQQADANFKVDRDIGALLPKDAVAQMAKPFAGLAKRWKPDANAYSSPLVASAARLPVQAENAEMVAALETLKSKFTGPNAQYVQKEIDRTLKKFRGITEAKDDAGKTSVKPPKAPEEF